MSDETTCPHCGRKLNTTVGVRIHIGRKHPETVTKATGTCTVPGCGRKLHPSGTTGHAYGKYCTTHHVRRERHGDLYEDVPIETVGGKTLAQRRAELQSAMH